MFDSRQLLGELELRGVKVGGGTNLLRGQWPAVEIYPRATSQLLTVSDWQRRQLEMLAYD